MTFDNDGQKEDVQFGPTPQVNPYQVDNTGDINAPNFQKDPRNPSMPNSSVQNSGYNYGIPTVNQPFNPQNFYGASNAFYGQGQYQPNPQQQNPQQQNPQQGNPQQGNYYQGNYQPQFNENYQIPNQYYYGQNQIGQQNVGYNQNWRQSQVGAFTGYDPTHWGNAGLTQNFYPPTPNNPYPVITPQAQPYNRFNMIWELLVTEASAFLPGITSAIVIGAQRLLNQNSTAIIQPLVTGHLALDIFLQVLVALFGTYAVFLIGYLLHRSGESFKAIGLTTKYTGVDIGLTILLAFGAFVIAFALGAATAALHLQPTNNPAVSPNINHYYLIVGFADSLYTSFLEEVAVCGFLLHRLQQMNVKPIYAILISTALRCSYHVYGGWPLLVMTIPFGLMQAAVYHKTRSIKCQVGAHFIYDFVIFSLNIL